MTFLSLSHPSGWLFLCPFAILNFSSTFVGIFNFCKGMITKDKQDEAQRHAQRNYVIQQVRKQLVLNDSSYTEADIFIGRIWGLGERKIREIMHSNEFSAVSADDLLKLAVILQRISKESRK